MPQSGTHDTQGELTHRQLPDHDVPLSASEHRFITGSESDALTEQFHAAQLHPEQRCAAPVPVLHRPASLRAPGGEFTAVLPALHHQQVWLPVWLSSSLNPPFRAPMTYVDSFFLSVR